MVRKLYNPHLLSFYSWAPENQMLTFVINLFIMIAISFAFNIARYFGEDGGNGDETGAVGSYHVEKLSAGNMKRTFVSHGKPRDWYDPAQGCGEEFLIEASEVKNIWVPMGEAMAGMGSGGGY